jgi:hypothetical protein
MKAKQLLDTIKDLDLRRFGKNQYTKNAKINGSNDGSESGGTIDKFYLKLNRENLHLDDFNYTGFDATIRHDLDFFFEDTDVNLIQKIIDNIKEQIDNLFEKEYTLPDYTPLFSYVSNETGLIGGEGDGVYPVFNIKYDTREEHIFIHITNTNYADANDNEIDLIFTQKRDGKFYYPELVG